MSDCLVPDHHGAKHKGHARCIRERRRSQAKANRDKQMETPKAIRNRQRMDRADATGRGSGSLVQEVQDQTPVQRKGEAAVPVRTPWLDFRHPVDLPEDRRRGR